MIATSKAYSLTKSHLPNATHTVYERVSVRQLAQLIPIAVPDFEASMEGSLVTDGY